MKYCFKTKSQQCEGTQSEISKPNCTGRFEIEKPVTEASQTEKCRWCNAVLTRDLQEEKPNVQFKGEGFHSTDYKKE